MKEPRHGWHHTGAIPTPLGKNKGRHGYYTPSCRKKKGQCVKMKSRNGCCLFLLFVYEWNFEWGDSVAFLPVEEIKELPPSSRRQAKAQRAVAFDCSNPYDYKKDTPKRCAFLSVKHIFLFFCVLFTWRLKGCCVKRNNFIKYAGVARGDRSVLVHTAEIPLLEFTRTVDFI